MSDCLTGSELRTLELVSKDENERTKFEIGVPFGFVKISKKGVFNYDCGKYLDLGGHKSMYYKKRSIKRHIIYAKNIHTFLFSESF